MFLCTGKGVETVEIIVVRFAFRVVREKWGVEQTRNGSFQMGVRIRGGDGAWVSGCFVFGSSICTPLSEPVANKHGMPNENPKG